MKKISSIIFLSLLICAFANEALAEDLQPEVGIYAGFDEPDPYNLTLRKVLVGQDHYRGCQLLIIPSFSTESAVYILGTQVVSRTIKKHLWSEMNREIGRQQNSEKTGTLVGNAAAQTKALAQLEILTETKTATLDEKISKALEDVCRKTLLRVKYPENISNGLDGVSYHAGHWISGAFLAGTTWSPEPNTIAGQFVEMELALKKFAEAPETKRDQAKSNLISKMKILSSHLDGKN